MYRHKTQNNEICVDSLITLYSKTWRLHLYSIYMRILESVIINHLLMGKNRNASNCLYKHLSKSLLGDAYFDF